MRIKGFLVAMLVLTGWTVAAIAAADPAPSTDLWTIYCRSYSGPTRVDQAKFDREQLIRTTGMKNWYVINKESDSTLFYGHYRCTDPDADDAKDRKDGLQAHEDLKKLKSMEDADKHKVFPLLVFVETPQPGYDGPPEWDLKKVPQDMCWTVYVGVYSGTPERRRAAVQAVKALRDAGKPAYYFHDTNASLVCIGTWPESAAKMPEEAVAPSNDPDTEVWAYGAALPANTPREAKTNTGKKVVIFSQTAQIIDPGLQSTCDLNPDFMTNGVVLGREGEDAVTHKKRVVPNHSQLFRIPDRAGSVAANSHQTEEQVHRQLDPTAHPPKGAGSLNKLPD